MPTDTADPRPTHVRYAIVLVAMLAAVLLYLERACLGIAEVFIREDLSISKRGMGWAMSAFYIAYALGQVPGGWLSQRYGPRLMMTLYMIGLAVFAVCIAASQDLVTLFASRFLLGLAQAGAYPTAALLVKRWFPDTDRGFASGVVSFGGRFGGASANWLTGLLIIAFVPMGVPTAVTPDQMLSTAPILAPTADQLKEQDNAKALAGVRDAIRRSVTSPGEVPAALTRWVETRAAFDGTDWANVPLPRDAKRIAAVPSADRTADESARLNRLVLEQAFPGAVRQLYTDGWRPTMFVYVGVALVVAALFWVVARDRPTDHGRCNAAERRLIVDGQAADGQRAGGTAVPWRELVRSRNQWYFSAFQLFTNLGWIFLMTYSARYLWQRFGTPLDERALMTTVPLFAAAFGMLFGGWLTDRLSRSLGVRWGRAIPGGAFKIPCMLAMVACPFLPTAWAVVMALTVMSVCTDIGVPSAWAFAQDTGGRQAATVLGWGNMWGNLGAAAGAVLLDTVATEWGLDAMTYCCAGAFAAAGVMATLANAAEPLFKDAEPK